MSFTSPKKTPQAEVSTIHRAAGIKLIITLKLPEMIGTEGGTAGGGPAWGGWAMPKDKAPVQVTKSPMTAAGRNSIKTVGVRPGMGGPIRPLGTT